MTIFIQYPPDTSFRGGIAVPDVLLDAQRKKVPDIYGAGNTINPATLMTGCFEFNSPVPLQRKTGGQPGIVGERLREARAVFNAALLPNDPEGERRFLYANQQLQNQTVSSDPPLEWEAKGRTFYVHPHNPTLHCLGLANRVRIEGQLRWVCTGVTPLLRVNLPNQPLSIGENIFGGEFPSQREFAQVGFQAIPGAGNLGWRLPPIEVPNLNIFGRWNTRIPDNNNLVAPSNPGEWGVRNTASAAVDGPELVFHAEDSDGNRPFDGIVGSGNAFLPQAFRGTSRLLVQYGNAEAAQIPLTSSLYLTTNGTENGIFLRKYVTGTSFFIPTPGDRPDNGEQSLTLSRIVL